MLSNNEETQTSEYDFCALDAFTICPVYRKDGWYQLVCYLEFNKKVGITTAESVMKGIGIKPSAICFQNK